MVEESPRLVLQGGEFLHSTEQCYPEWVHVATGAVVNAERKMQCLERFVRAKHA